MYWSGVLALVGWAVTAVAQGNLGLGDTSACAPSYSNYQYVGCYSDALNGNHLNFPFKLSTVVTDRNGYPGYSNTANLTVDLCLGACRAHGYRIANVYNQYECWCGTQLPYPTAPSGATVDVGAGVGTYSGTSPGTPSAGSNCNRACPANSSQICGGAGYGSVYADQSFQNDTSPASIGAYSNYQYFGCYVNSGGSPHTFQIHAPSTGLREALEPAEALPADTRSTGILDSWAAIFRDSLHNSVFNIGINDLQLDIDDLNLILLATLFNLVNNFLDLHLAPFHSIPYSFNFFNLVNFVKHLLSNIHLHNFFYIFHFYIFHIFNSVNIVKHLFSNIHLHFLAVYILPNRLGNNRWGQCDVYLDNGILRRDTNNKHRYNADSKCYYHTIPTTFTSTYTTSYTTTYGFLAFSPLSTPNLVQGTHYDSHHDYHHDHSADNLHINLYTRNFSDFVIHDRPQLQQLSDLNIPNVYKLQLSKYLLEFSLHLLNIINSVVEHFLLIDFLPIFLASSYLFFPLLNIFPNADK
ncbi:MAG: hypothetical protein L6R40_004773 [Gallowayella cf. fulva]|nr:MAG: hypothetical protein L6R40_004773 [Xanthomendoza cf. fulva]